MRLALALSCVLASLVIVTPPARACMYANEAEEVAGWSDDGKYVLYVMPGKDKDTVHHAEIHPTTIGKGWLYWIEAEEGMIVHRRPQAECEPWDGAIVEKKPGAKPTRAALFALATVKKLRITPATIAINSDINVADLSVSIEPKKRYANHQLVVTDKGGKNSAALHLPTWCVGSCIRDEDWQRWAASVRSVRKVGALTLYEVKLDNVCNGGTPIRLIAPAAPGAKPPKRCER